MEAPAGDTYIYGRAAAAGGGAGGARASVCQRARAKSNWPRFAGGTLKSGGCNSVAFHQYFGDGGAPRARTEKGAATQDV